MTVKNSKKCPCVHIWVNSQTRHMTDFDLYSYLPLKFSYSRRVNDSIIIFGVNKVPTESSGLSLVFSNKKNIN